MVSRRALFRYVLPTAAGAAVVVIVGNPIPALRTVLRPSEASGGDPFRRTITCMGTFVSIAVYDRSEGRAQVAVAAAFDEIRTVDRLMSIFRPDSDLARINRAAGHGDVVVDSTVCEVLDAAIGMGSGSGGRFDVTVLPLLRLFGLRDEAPAALGNGVGERLPHRGKGNGGQARRAGLPAPEDMGRALSTVDYRRIRVDPERHRVGLELSGAEIDLGGIAKGHAVDRAVKALEEHGIENAVLDAGGDLYAMGSPANGDGWPIGIQDPLHPDRVVGTVWLRDQAVATSGNYAQFATIDGDRYGHLFDTAAGVPVDPVASATVVAPTAMEADALSTTAYLMGLDSGSRFADTMDDVDAVFLTVDDSGGVEAHGTVTSSRAP